MRTSIFATEYVFDAEVERVVIGWYDPIDDSNSNSDSKSNSNSNSASNTNVSAEAKTNKSKDSAEEKRIEVGKPGGPSRHIFTMFSMEGGNFTIQGGGLSTVSFYDHDTPDVRKAMPDRNKDPEIREERLNLVQMQTWYAILADEDGDGGRFVQFKSAKTAKFIRVFKNKIDVEGTGGRSTFFKIHNKTSDGFVHFESAEVPGKYLAVQSKVEPKPVQATVGIPVVVADRGLLSKLQVFRESFTRRYLFTESDYVVIFVTSHTGDGGPGCIYLDNDVGYLSKSLSNIKTFKYTSCLYEQSAWSVNFPFDDNTKISSEKLVRLRNCSSEKFLCISDKGKFSVKGDSENPGQTTVFRVHNSDAQHRFLLESVAFAGQYLGCEINESTSSVSFKAGTRDEAALLEFWRV